MATGLNISSLIVRSTTTKPDDGNPLDHWADDPVWQMVDFILSSAVHFVLSFLGIIANLINIIVFVKQDHRETVNISLLALCVADLGYSLTLFWESICVNPYLQKSDIPVAVSDLSYLTAVLPNGVFSRISTLIHVYITLERCLCIAMPLKIKEIFTPNQSITTMAGIYLLSTLSILPMYLSGYLELSINPTTNTTVYVLVSGQDAVYLQSIGLSLSAFFLIVPYVMETFFTVVIILQLQIKSKWRKEMTSISTTNKLTTKDRKVIKMIAFISSLFIVCTFLNCVNFLQALIGYFNPTQLEVLHLFFIPWSIVFTSEQILHTVNILIFYNMSSNYKLVFCNIFFIIKLSKSDSCNK